MEASFETLIEEFLRRNTSSKVADKITVKTFAEYVRLFIVEALQRAQKEAAGDLATQEVIVDAQHLEKILPQLLLDFC